MASGRRVGLAVAALVCIALTLGQLPASGHKAAFKSRATLKAGYGFFRGTVGSSLAACRDDRTVKLFKAVAGTDPLIKSTKTNAAGDWAIFQSYEVATFYVKVPARTIRRSGHTHTCKATRSTLTTAPTRVSPSDLDGWGITQYDCLDYAGNPGGATPLDAEPFVNGPETPPMGFGSLWLTPPSNFGFSFTFARWDGLEGQPLSGLRSINYSTFIDDNDPPIAPPPTLSLHVDVTGDGGSTEKITFVPPDPSVVADEWQKWKAGRASTWETPGGPMSLSDYEAAHPSAEFEDFPLGVEFESDCPDAGAIPHYLDAVVIRLDTETMGFDFES